MYSTTPVTATQENEKLYAIQENGKTYSVFTSDVDTARKKAMNVYSCRGGFVILFKLNINTLQFEEVLHITAGGR